jgi:dUTP pyrophosphatase
MSKIDLKIKKLATNAVMPKYAKSGDAGLDLTAITKIADQFGNLSYGTGLAVEIPEGYVGLLFPRSSNSKKDLILSNCVGVIDSGYRGELIVKYKKVKVDNIFFSDNPSYYDIGERVAQLVIVEIPSVTIIETDELSDTERGDGGFGSTGQ